MANKVLTVLAAWGGPRRKLAITGDYYNKDRTAFLKHGYWPKDTSDFICVAPIYKDEPKYFTDYLEDIGAKRRPSNSYFSYGSFTYAYSLFPDFDYYILLEDDYSFVEDNFTDKLISMMKPKDAILCGLIGHSASGGDGDSIVQFPANSISIIRREFLYEWAKIEKPPHEHGETTYEEAELCQVWMGRAAKQLGFTVSDWLDYYSTPFWKGDHRIYEKTEEGVGARPNCETHRPEGSKAPFIVPTQAIIEKTPIDGVIYGLHA